MKKYISLFLALSMLASCGQAPAQTGAVSDTQTAETEEAKEGTMYTRDAQQLVYALEAAHAAFIIDAVPEGYEDAKAEFLKAAENTDNIDDFALAARKYLCVMKDIHTMVYTTTDQNISSLNGFYERFDVGYTTQGDTLCLTDDDRRPTDSVILKIGGVDVSAIFDTIDEYFPIENSEAQDFFRRNYSLSKEVLKLSGCDIENDEIEIECSDKTFTAAYKTPETTDEAQSTPSAAVRKINDILYIELNSFMVKDETYADILEEIRGYIDEGTTKVILDVRNNSGGYMAFVDEAMRAFGTNLPKGEEMVRRSLDEWESCKLDLEKAVKDTTNTVYPASANLTRINPDIDLVVLCNANSASASVKLCSGVQDGKLGTVIGSRPYNSPSFYGGRVTYDLPETGIHTILAAGYTKRFDENADQEVFQPDILLDRYDDALKYAVEEYFNEEYNEE